MININNTDTYPVVLIPDYIKQASSSKVKFEEVYPNIKKPSEPYRKKVEKKESDNLKGYVGCGCLTYFGIGIFCRILSSILDISENTYKTYWFPIIIVITIIVVVIMIYLGNKGEEFDNKKNYEEYKKNFQIYIENLKKYNELVSKVNTDKFQLIERHKRKIIIFEDNRKQIFKNLEILDDNAVKKGISEEFFHRFLLKYSDITVYKSIKYSYYYPDLILVKSNIVTILEIDEPYANDTKEPIHFDNTDKNRDDYFISKNFIIIRFTEEQILNYTEECLEIINEIIGCCIDLKSYSKSDSFTKIETTKLSYQEAFDLAYNNSRKSVPDKIKRLEKKYF